MLKVGVLRRAATLARAVRESRGGRLQNLQAREVAAQIAAIDGRQTIALNLRVRGDEKVGQEVLTRATFPAVLPMNASGQVRRSGGDGVVANGQHFQMPEQLVGRFAAGGEFREDDRTNPQGAFLRSFAQHIFPRFVAGFFFPDGEKNRGVDGGLQSRVLTFFSGRLAGPRSLVRACWLVNPR